MPRDGVLALRHGPRVRRRPPLADVSNGRRRGRALRPGGGDQRLRRARALHHRDGDVDLPDGAVLLGAGHKPDEIDLGWLRSTASEIEQVSKHVVRYRLPDGRTLAVLADSNPLNIVHCDISPPNVLVSFEGETKIIDFGIAKSALRATATDPKMGFGKFGYMAPEQLVRGGVVDARTDLYAVGAVLFELLTGERLYEVGDNPDYRALARMVVKGEHRQPSQLDPALARFDALVTKMLRPRPEDRFQTAAELRDAVQAALVAIAPGRPRPDRAGTARPSRSRRRCCRSRTPRTWSAGWTRPRRCGSTPPAPATGARPWSAPRRR